MVIPILRKKGYRHIINDPEMNKIDRDYKNCVDKKIRDGKSLN